jgi:segregation and condensation protein B
VAYNQPITSKRVSTLRGHPSGAILAQLVRRRLLQIERPKEKPRTPTYHTTERFLDLFNLDSLQDLPQSQDLDG